MAFKDKKDPQEDLIKLNKVISSNEFSHVHVLYGEEVYLVKQFKDKLIDALTGGDKGMNFDKFSGKNTTPEHIIDLAETMPFFSERRVILIEDSEWFCSECDALAAYIEQGICETTYIVFCEKKIDKKYKLTKVVQKEGLISEFMPQTENTLLAWLGKQLKDDGYAITGKDAKYLLDLAGSDMKNLSNELAKLTAYCYGRNTITAADIDAICSRRLEDRVFDMCEQLALHRQKSALNMYYDLINMRESSFKILTLVTRQYNILLKVKDMELDKKSDREIAQAVGLRDWTVKGYRAQTSHYTLGELKKIVNKCADLDMRIKTGMIADDIGLETLLVELSTGKQ